MAEPARPFIAAKPKPAAMTPPSLPTPPRRRDRMLILGGLAVGSLVLGYGLFDLGLRSGLGQGASLALQCGQERRERLRADEDDWKEEFRGREFATLQRPEKIAWLRKEEGRIRDLICEEQAECGRAYIEKEDAYREYDKKGGYGGEAWKRYSVADETCQAIYDKWERQQKRLSQIRKEINALTDTEQI
ncbi:hypothetical protein BUE80_DR006479 [Diplocarpon rosae]|nr:hypothetical protein BUE80_DR006479 [Diplocarpon rosae]